MKPYNFLSILLVTLIFSHCSPNSQKQDEKLDNIGLAKEIETQLNIISSALTAVEDYDSMRVAEKKIEPAGAEIAKLYTLAKQRKTSPEVAAEMKLIIQSASERLTETKIKTLAKFKDNPAVTYGLVIMLNNLSESYQEASGAELPTQVIQAPVEKE